MSGSARWQPQVSTNLAEASAARTWARRTLPGLLEQPGGAALGDDVELLLSELCTNAVNHGGGLEEVRLHCTPTSVRVTVHDLGVGTPVARSGVTTDDDHGRGLILVEAIAADWGVDTHPGGKDVWFELSLRRRSPSG